MKTTTTASIGSRAMILASLLAAGATHLSACASHVSPEVSPCPCATGFVCCDSGVCAATVEACGVATAALSRSVQGEWSGYIEGLPAGQDDRIRISIATDANGVLSGHVVLSASSNPPPPATDPNVGWPPDYDGSRVVRGFAYPAHDIHWESQRLKLRVERLEAWQDWCALQTPYPTSLESDPTSYRCGPRPPNDYCALQGPDTVLTSFELCNDFGVCECTATDCHAAPPNSWIAPAMQDRPLLVDIALRNGQGDGSIDLTVAGFGIRNVRLQRGAGPPTGMGGAPGGVAGATGQGGATWDCSTPPGIGGGPGSGPGGMGGPGGMASCPETFGRATPIELGPHNHVFANPTYTDSPAMNYAGQVVFPNPSLSLTFDPPAVTDTLTLDPFSGVALDPWLGELSLLAAGCHPLSLVGRTVHVKVLWRLLGAIGSVPDHAIYLGTYHNGVPAPYADAIAVYPKLVSGQDPGVRTLNTLAAVELTHTFTADDDGSGGIFLRVYLRDTDGEIPTTVYVGAVDW